MRDDPFDGGSGPAFGVTQAIREAVPSLVAVWGHSDSGKTFSSLRLARGLVGPKGKIVLIDTENRRAKLYAGLFGGWFHIDLQPPFTPARYTAAYNAAIQAGADVIIVDSQSHVWEGEGGVLDQADASSSKGLAKWKAPKTAYKRMTNALFRAPVHMIFCIRAKEKFVQQTSTRGKDEIVSAGEVPICDSRFIFEMTVAVRMESGKRTPMAPIKAPDQIAHCIRPGEFITEDCGRALAAWLAEGTAVDHAALALQAKAREVAAEGTEALRAWWGSTVTKADRKKLEPIIAELQDSASQADRDALEARRMIEDANGDGDPLSDPFTPDTVSAQSTADESAAPGGSVLPSLPAKPSPKQWREWAESAVEIAGSLRTEDDCEAFRQHHATILARLDEHHPDLRQKVRAALGG